MYKTIIGIKDKGKLVPESVVKALIEDYNSASAVVAAMEDDIFLHRWDSPITLEDFMDAQKQAQALELGFVFTKGDNVSVESRQPFVMVKTHDEAKVVCIALIAGTFPQFAPPKSAHSPEYHMKERIQKKLDRIYTSANDIEGFKKLLREGEFAEDLDLMTAPDGIVTFMTFDGEFISHGQDSGTRGEFPWGKISQVVGELVKKEEKKVEEKPKSGLFNKLKASVAAEPKKESEVPKQDTAASNSKADTAVDIASTIEFEMWKPPVGLKTKAFNKLMNETIGCVPHGAWDTYSANGSFPRPTLGASGFRAKFKHSNLYEQFRTATEKATTTRVPAAVLIQATQPKGELASKEAAQAVTHIVGAEGKKHFTEKFMKRPSVMQAVAESRELVLNPKVLQKMDNRASTTFAEQSGMRQGVLDTLGWSEEDIQTFLKEEDPRLVFLWARDLQLQVISNLAAKGDKLDTKPAEETPPKKSLFGGARKAS